MHSKRSVRGKKTLKISTYTSNFPYITSEGVLTGQLRCLTLQQEAMRLNIALDFCQMSFFVSSVVIRNVSLHEEARLLLADCFLQTLNCLRYMFMYHVPLTRKGSRFNKALAH